MMTPKCLIDFLSLKPGQIEGQIFQGGRLTDRNNLAEELTLSHFIEKHFCLCIHKKKKKNCQHVTSGLPHKCQVGSAKISMQLPKKYFYCSSQYLHDCAAIHRVMVPYSCVSVYKSHIFFNIGVFFFIFYLLSLSATYSCIFTSDNSKHSYRR